MAHLFQNVDIDIPYTCPLYSLDKGGMGGGGEGGEGLNPS